MKRKTLYIVLFLFFLSLNFPVLAQNLRWVKITTFPYRNTRKDDVCFINSQTGWVIDGTGYVYNTRNGGYTWTTKIFPVSWLRCVAFTDSLNGFIGVYDSTTVVHAALMRTTDGGLNWFKVNNIPAPRPKGICGLNVIGNCIYAVGRIEGPAILLKSTDRGNTWLNLSTNLDTLADKLVDVYFFSPDSGFITGGKGAATASLPVVLATSDGGTTWQQKFRGTFSSHSQAIWKIQFINRNTSFGSYNQLQPKLEFIKTTNGGNNWVSYTQSITSPTFTQGIGFINNETGWLGGGTAYKTTNGGINWFGDNELGDGINRFRFYSDTLAYACGMYFYKYTSDPAINIENNSEHIPDKFILHQNYPNPFNPSTTISYNIITGGMVKIKIYDTNGKLVRNLLETNQSAGPNQIIWNGLNDNGMQCATGVYFSVLEFSDMRQVKKMVLIK